MVWHGLGNFLLILTGKGPHFQVFLDGHIGKDPPSFGTMGNPQPHDGFGAFVPQLLSHERNRSGLGAQQPRNRPQRRRLAGAVRADEADDLSFFDVQADSLQGVNRAVIDVDIL